MKTIKSIQFTGRPPMIFDQAITGYLHVTSTGIVSIELTADERRVIIRTKRDVVVVPAAACYITFDDYPELRISPKVEAPSDYAEPNKKPTAREAAARARWQRARAEREALRDE